MSGRTARWMIPWAILVGLWSTTFLAAQDAPEPSSPLSAAEVARLFGSSVVLIKAEFSDDQTQIGSGFFVTAEGVVATSLHLLDGARSASVQVDGKRFLLQSVRAFDLDQDLALLQIEGEGFVAALPGETAGLRRGDPIYVISNPLGLAGTVSEGLLAAWREPNAEMEEDLDAMAQLGGLARSRLMQISAPTSPGSSGAPVFDEYGFVIGVVAAGFGAGTLDLNFAVPIEGLVPLLDRDEGWDLESLRSILDRQRRDLADPYLVDARFYLATDQPEEASRALDRALGVFPRSAEALALKGRVLLQGGRIDEAKELFRQAVAANPDSVEAWEDLGHLLLTHGTPHEAAAAFQKALELDPWRAEAAFGLGVTRGRQRRLREARPLLEQAVELDRDHVRAWVSLGFVCLMLEDRQAAEEAFDSALWLDSDNPQAICGLGTVFAKTGDNRATEYLQRCERLSRGSP